MPAKRFHNGNALKIWWHRNQPVLGATAISWREVWEERSAPNHRGPARAHPTSTGNHGESVTTPQGQEKGKGLCITWGFTDKGFCSGGGRLEGQSSQRVKQPIIELSTLIFHLEGKMHVRDS